MKRSNKNPFPLLLKGTSLALILLVGSHRGLAQKIDLRLTPASVQLGLEDVPPGVERATVQLLDREGTALLEVIFDKQDERVKKGVSLVLGGKETFLRDDGVGGDAKADDGIFSAVIEIDPKTITAQADFAIQTLGKNEPRAVFRGREIVGLEDPDAAIARSKQLIELQDLDRLVKSQTKINLFNFIPLISPAAIDPRRSLMITTPRVVQDPLRTIDPCTGAGTPKGVWTFRHLVTEMVGTTGVDPSVFVERWLRLWLSPQLVSSGFSAVPRTNMLARVLNPWPRLPNGLLDLDQSPFRLSAIVNRIDLSNNPVYGGGNAGEGRFVFGVLDRSQGGCAFLPFSVIFEYGVPISGCEAVSDWANQWVNLSLLPLGSPAYNAALEAITEQFVRAGVAPSKPNGSALNQLRTNENALNIVWELREFKLGRSSPFLFEDTVKQTPDETLNNSPVFSNFVNTTPIPQTVPDRFPGLSPFMAATARATAINQLNTHFQGPGIIDNNKRFLVSVDTCTSCHIRETSTNGTPAGNNAFLHVDPRPMPAQLSRFLTGATVSILDSPDLFLVNDPVVGATLHPFNDLDRRRQKLASLAGSACITRILVPPQQLFEVLRPIVSPEFIPQISDPRLDSVNIPILSPH